MLISPSAQNLLKILHLLAVSFWVGGLLANIIVTWALPGAQSGGELYGMLRAVRFVNIVVVVYLGAFGSFFTGLAYSLCTNRGFFRHKWVILKWVLTVGLMTAGGTILLPISTAMLEMVQAHGLEALNLDLFTICRLRLMSLHSLQLGLFVLMFFLSVYKPWEKVELSRSLTMRRR